MKIKEKPEDFIVKEEAQLEFSEGKYAYFLLEKKNWNTLDVIREIARRLNLKEKDIGFAGNKDRRAWTFQHISIPISKERVLGLKIKDVKLSYLGNGDKRINLGRLKGNNFEIVIRDCKGIEEKDFIINYFGEQRFGVENKNWKIGKYLIKGKFKDACKLLDLKVERNDYLGALKKEGFRTLKFYIASYQSYLWNKVVDGKGKVPILGYLTEGHVYDKIMEEEGIKKTDFIIKSFRELSAEGSERESVVEVKDFKSEKIEEGVYRVSFFLSKGAYATEVLRQIVL